MDYDFDRELDPWEATIPLFVAGQDDVAGFDWMQTAPLGSEYILVDLSVKPYGWKRMRLKARPQKKKTKKKRSKRKKVKR